MRIFIGSSRESTEAMEWVAVCLEDFGHEPLKWDEPGVFPPGENTFLRLIELSKTVDAAIFIFGPDDRVWYRGDAAHQPRDNVLIEYGLFSGQLGPQKCIISAYGSPKESSDLRGLTFVDINTKRRQRARAELRLWANALKSEPLDLATLQLMAKVAEKEREIELVNRRLTFGNETVRDLEELLTRHGVIDFSTFDLGIDGHWKLLFDFDYFWEVAEAVASVSDVPRQWKRILLDARSHAVVERIQWDPFEKDAGHTAFFVRKGLRLFRELGADSYRLFLDNTTEAIRGSINQIANALMIKKETRRSKKGAGDGQ